MIIRWSSDDHRMPLFHSSDDHRMNDASANFYFSPPTCSEPRNFSIFRRKTNRIMFLTYNATCWEWSYQVIATVWSRRCWKLFAEHFSFFWSVCSFMTRHFITVSLNGLSTCFAFSILCSRREVLKVIVDLKHFDVECFP